jgi:hypothetical protein
VAERIRKELGVEVDEVSGSYGEFTVLVDGEEIRRGNPLATSLAIMPPAGEIVAAVKARLSG